MWHVDTKVGVFWILAPESPNEKFMLGCNSDTIAEFSSLEEAVLGVAHHDTGHIEWDLAEKVRTPKSLNDWQRGEPASWQMDDYMDLSN